MNKKTFNPHQTTWICRKCKNCTSIHINLCDKCQGPPEQFQGTFPSHTRAPFWQCARWSQKHYVFPSSPLLWTMNLISAPDDWLFTATWNIQFMEALLAHGLFTIPDQPGIVNTHIMLPNPVQRYCLDLTKTAPNERRHYHKSKEMRPSKRKRYRLSVNSDFKGALKLLMDYHNKKDGTWMTEALIDCFHTMNQDVNSIVKHWAFELWSLKKDQKKEDHEWQLVAITAGMSVGCCFHDYSMATLVRDKRNLGHVLTKTVADLLKTCGFKIWYWGYKTGYMQQYDHYGGRLFNRRDFWHQWSSNMLINPECNVDQAIAQGMALVQPVQSVQLVQSVQEEPQDKTSTSSSSHVTIFGYGSLLSESSAKRTCPNLTNFRVASIKGWERIFSLVSVSQLKNGNANVEENQIAALAVRKSTNPSALCIGTLFDIEEKDLLELTRREHRYNMTEIQAFDGPNDSTSVTCIVFTASSDEEYKLKCQKEGDNETFHTIVGQYYNGQLWGRKDIFPVTKYLHYCCDAASKLSYRGDSAICQTNFLESFLADETTTIGEYMKKLSTSNKKKE